MSTLKRAVKRFISPARSDSPAQFDEADFVAGFLETHAQKGGNEALTYLLNNAPEMLKSNLGRQEKLNNLLYMTRMIQSTGTTKHGVAKAARKSNRMWKTWNQWGETEPATFIDFGCGAHDPIAMSSFMYGAGFKRALANDQKSPRNPVYSALSLLEILALLRLRPEKYLPEDIEPEIFFERLADFDLDALAEGDFVAGIAPMEGRIDYASCDIVNADIAEREASMIVSYAVFEHVMDVPGILDFLYSRTAPGGLGFHFIDLRDHRAYRRTEAYNEFSFLCEETGPENLNRLRQSEQVAAFTKAGFDILSIDGIKQPFPEEMRSRLIPRFADLDQDDLETVAVTLIVRRPA